MSQAIRAVKKIPVGGPHVLPRLPCEPAALAPYLTRSTLG